MDIQFILIIVAFLIGYVLITVEHKVGINKTAVALMTGIVCWIIQFFHVGTTIEQNQGHLGEHLSNISQVVFFLLSALAIVETINSHKGFNLISDYIQIRSKRKLLWLVGLITFFLSSVLDNLTTTIIMVTLIRKLIPKGEERLLVGGAIVIAANAGGAWTPIGDVTTTMLWIGGQLSTITIIKDLFLPSITCAVVSFFMISLYFKGEFPINETAHQPIEPHGKLIFWLGIGCLIFVPIFKIITNLPPYMGMMFGLSVVWLVTDIVHRNDKSREHLKLPYTISKIDISSVLFFLGILLCIDALDTSNVLSGIAHWFDRHISSPHLIAVILGLISAVLDNVPLVAAIMSMYPLSTYPIDSSFWQLIAYCAGTGGSILVIGSAAGVAFMGMERVRFFWYMKKVGFPALIGYFAGIGVYELFM